MTDQAELHGLLAKVRDLGTTLISVTTIDASEMDGRSRSARPDRQAATCASSRVPIWFERLSARYRQAGDLDLDHVGE